MKKNKKCYRCEKNKENLHRVLNRVTEKFVDICEDCLEEICIEENG